MTRLSIPDMSCAHCKAAVEAALAPLAATVTVDTTGRTATVTGAAAPDALLAALDRAGYPSRLIDA